MPAEDALTVSLTPEPNGFIHATVASGRRQAAVEAVRAGPRSPTWFDPAMPAPAPRPTPRRRPGTAG